MTFQGHFPLRSSLVLTIIDFLLKKYILVLLAICPVLRRNGLAEGEHNLHRALDGVTTCERQASATATFVVHDLDRRIAASRLFRRAGSDIKPSRTNPR